MSRCVVVLLNIRFGILTQLSTLSNSGKKWGKKYKIAAKMSILAYEAIFFHVK